MISLNYRDARPIYEQVRDSVRQLILTGAIGSGEKLPSVRELAASLAINPNTIQRAYRELEADGFIFTVPGKGAFAAGDTAAAKKRQTQLETSFSDICRELSLLGMTEAELCRLIHQTLAEQEETR